MDQREAFDKLCGSIEDKVALLDHLTAVASERQLEDWETVMLEALKKELIVKRETVHISASLAGKGKVS